MIQCQENWSATDIGSRGMCPSYRGYVCVMLNVSQHISRWDRKSEYRSRNTPGFSVKSIPDYFDKGYHPYDIEEESSWTVLFADNLVLCDREWIEELEWWRERLEDAALNLSRYMSPQNDSRKWMLKNYNQDYYTELSAVSQFKYLGTLASHWTLTWFDNVIVLNYNLPS